jgi:hypothetical protein
MSETRTAEVVIPEDVWAFAREQDVEVYLPVVLEAARRNFPGSGLRVLVEEDHEIEDLRYIVVMVRDLKMDMERYLTANDEFNRSLFAALPVEAIGAFRLGLE